MLSVKLHNDPKQEFFLLVFVQYLKKVEVSPWCHSYSFPISISKVLKKLSKEYANI